MISGLVVVASYFLGRRQSDIRWKRELSQQARERKRRTPKLKVIYRHEPPMARLSGRTDRAGNSIGDFYDFHFRIENESKSQQAQKVEAVIEGIWMYDDSGDPIPIGDFFPIRLRYDSKGTEFVDINPQRYIPWNLGYIPNPSVQEDWLGARQYVDAGGIVVTTGHRFYLDVAEFPFHQPNRFPPGRYGILVSIYAENAKRVDQHFEIKWSGKWGLIIQDIVKEIVIEPVDGIE